MASDSKSEAMPSHPTPDTSSASQDAKHADAASLAREVAAPLMKRDHTVLIQRSTHMGPGSAIDKWLDQQQEVKSSGMTDRQGSLFTLRVRKLHNDFSNVAVRVSNIDVDPDCVLCAYLNLDFSELTTHQGQWHVFPQGYLVQVTGVPRATSSGVWSRFRVMDMRLEIPLETPKVKSWVDVAVPTDVSDETHIVAVCKADDEHARALQVFKMPSYSESAKITRVSYATPCTGQSERYESRSMAVCDAHVMTERHTMIWAQEKLMLKWRHMRCGEQTIVVARCVADAANEQYLIVAKDFETPLKASCDEAQWTVVGTRKDDDLFHVKHVQHDPEGFWRATGAAPRGAHKVSLFKCHFRGNDALKHEFQRYRHTDKLVLTVAFVGEQHNYKGPGPRINQFVVTHVDCVIARCD